MRLAGLVSALLLGLLLTQTFVASEETPAGARTLRPGDNLIGWVGYPTTTEAFFEQLAEAELIYTWDAQLSRYQFAARAFEANLSMIKPGMGSSFESQAKSQSCGISPPPPMASD